MTKNAIQEQRMKSYFLEATKEILISEGIKALSVRNVAERAGYSYATLYNYYKSLGQLISLSIYDFQKECTAHVEQLTAKMDSGKDKLAATLHAYANYLVQYPSLFDLFYKEELSSTKINHSAALFLEELCDNELCALISDSTYTEDQVDSIKKSIRFTIPGIMLLYMNRSYPLDYKEFKTELNTQINEILLVQ